MRERYPTDLLSQDLTLIPDDPLIPEGGFGGLRFTWGPSLDGGLEEFWEF
jgi:hypothetical protein